MDFIMNDNSDDFYHIREKLANIYYEFRYGNSGEFIYFYKRDPFIHGPEILCVFNTQLKTFYFEKKCVFCE